MSTPSVWHDTRSFGAGGVVGVSTPSVWPDASSLGGEVLPDGGLGGSPSLGVGSSSGYSQHLSLSPMYQPSVGFNQPNSPIVKPSFCIHFTTILILSVVHSFL